MKNIPEKVLQRFRTEHKEISKIIISAIERDINEADTVVIVNDVLSKILGYDKYTEITREFAIRGTYCDLAVRIDNNIIFLIEVKAIGIKLNDKHLKQAIDYAAHQGIDWIILTNGVVWNIYKLSFKKPINAKLIFSFNFLKLVLKKEEDQEQLYLLSREGIRKNAILELSEYRQLMNKFYISAILQEENFISGIRKIIKKINPKARVENSEILSILMNDIIKRDIVESDEFSVAQKKHEKFTKNTKTTTNQKSVSKNLKTIKSENNDNSL